MIFENSTQIPILEKRLKQNSIPQPERLLMVSPEHYDVKYAINDFMRTSDGNLQKVDLAKAKTQWQRLIEKYEKIGCQVDTLSGEPNCPDMVYSANHALPFWDPKTREPNVVMAKMASPFRQPEIPFFEKWYASQGYRVHYLSEAISKFEGMGDALLHPGKRLIWGGVGQRTQEEAYQEIAAITGYDIVLLPLQSKPFYHLDTCLSILNTDSAIILPAAFSKESMALLRSVFSTIVEVGVEENAQYLLANCFCPNGKDVLVQAGSKKFCSQLNAFGFRVHEMETGEFLKGGGSVFCMKMAVY